MTLVLWSMSSSSWFVSCVSYPFVLLHIRCKQVLNRALISILNPLHSDMCHHVMRWESWDWPKSWLGLGRLRSDVMDSGESRVSYHKLLCYLTHWHSPLPLLSLKSPIPRPTLVLRPSDARTFSFRTFIPLPRFIRSRQREVFAYSTSHPQPPSTTLTWCIRYRTSDIVV